VLLLVFSGPLLIMWQIFLGGILVTSASAGPLVKRAQDVVQNQLGSDGYWNDFDGAWRGKSIGTKS